MNANLKKPVIGLLGGIASGKSTVASVFQDLGCAVISADLWAHKALEQDAIQTSILSEFGPDIADLHGSIDRSALGRIVFREAGKLDRLTDLLHPWILEKCQEKLKEYQKNPDISAIVLDMPLLLEVQWDRFCDYIVFVECPKEIRLRRAVNRGISPESLVERENFQISLDKKAHRADNIVVNISDLSSLVSQVAKIFTSVINN